MTLTFCNFQVRCCVLFLKTEQFTMKTNIIYLNQAASVDSAFPRPLRIDLHTGTDFIDSALVIWLGAWTLIATFAFLAI
jgi:hypothetical protein